ncbi:G-alpha-domain-containing protein [Trametes elegans]|nr:G-alpha-domain-containing protein [Trametes elegans]
MHGKSWGKGASPRNAQPSANAWPPYPPADETELEKAVRLEEEREARRISEAIDRELENERQAIRRVKKSETKLLLLGQSESGKSTMLKNFQIQFAPNALRAESEAWRAVIHLNLVRSVNFILDVLTNPSTPTSGGDSPTNTHRPSSQPLPVADLRRLRLALSPLKQVEMILVRHLSADDPSSPSSGRASPVDQRQTKAAEVTIRGSNGWRALLKRQQEPEEQQSRFSETRVDELENARQILYACRKDIVAMWSSKSVRTALRDEGVMLEDHMEFFLNHAGRVTEMEYEPTFPDILRARLQTVGVEEHHLIMETMAESGQHWIFYDVGGARGQRASWVPFFEDINAIIFLCSAAGFSEVLAEDRGVNRLLDSFNTWKIICASKLLVSVQFILLLNKMDLLEARLRAGIRFSDYVKSYKGKNTTEHVTDYLKRKFTAIHVHHSPQDRKLHIHSTCAINIDTTSAVLMRSAYELSKGYQPCALTSYSRSIVRDTILVNDLAAVGAL